MTAVKGTEGDPARNEDLDALHRQLVGLVARLDLAVEDASSAAEVKALNAQIAAANARVAAVGRLLFARRTAEVATAAAAVSNALPEVERALADLAGLDEFVANCTGVFKLVDHAVDAARMAV